MMLFLAGEWRRLHQLSTPKVSKSTRPSVPTATRVIAKAKEGNLSAATQALKAMPPAPATMESAQKLKAKHPPRKRDIDVEVDQERQSLFDFDDFQKTVRSLPKSKAPGNSGMKYEFFRGLIASKTSMELLFRVCHSWSLAEDDTIADELRPWIFGGRLLGLSKPDNDVRPISMGEALVKLTAKCIITGQKEEMTEFFPKGHQFGVAFSGGTEFFAKLVSVLREELTEHVFMSLDFANAFNSVSRASIAEELKKHFPQLLPWFMQMYGHTSNLVFGLRDGEVVILNSAEGDQQGDPLAPFYFALAIQAGIYEIREVMKNDDKFADLFAYLDDSQFCIHYSKVKEYFALAEPIFASRGLTLNVKKTEILASPALIAAEGKSWKPKEAKLFVEGNKMLGVPVGSDEFIRGYLAEKIEKTRKTVEDIVALGDAQISFLLLRVCVPPRMIHLLRNVEPRLTAPFAQQFDAILRSALGRIAQIELEEDSLPWLQARLRLSHGGAGFLCAEWNADIAYAASWASFAQNEARLKLLQEPHSLSRLEYGTSPLALSLHEVESLLRSSGLEKLPSIWNPLSTVATNKLQYQLYGKKVTEMRTVLLNRCSVEHLQWLTSKSTYGANRWLYVVPAAPEFVMSSMDFVDALRYHLGLGPRAISNREALSGKLCACGRFVFDPQSDPFSHFLHLEMCAKLGGRTRRHDSLVSLFARFCEACGHAAQVEPKSLFVDVLGSIKSQKRGDALVPDLVNGLPTLTDVSITNPCQSRELTSTSLKPFHAANTRFRQKESKYRTLCNQAGLQFLPLIFESTGAIHPRVIEVIADLSAAYKDQYDAPHWTSRTPEDYWLNRFSVQLQLDLARYVRTLAAQATYIP